jgi:hypothetical protein
MTDYTGAPCLTMDPEEFADAGTPFAWNACRICHVRNQCLTDAKAEGANGVYRGGVAFAPVGSSHPIGNTTAIRQERWREWARMRARGMSYPQIAEATGYHHSTIMNALKRAGG